MTRLVITRHLSDFSRPDDVTVAIDLIEIDFHLRTRRRVESNDWGNSDVVAI